MELKDNKLKEFQYSCLIFPVLACLSTVYIADTKYIIISIHTTEYMYNIYFIYYISLSISNCMGTLDTSPSHQRIHIHI